jgi:hypothetical protein
VASNKLSAEERLWANVDKSGEHWLWTGWVSGSGYGYLRRHYKRIGVHVLSFELAHGRPPVGLVRHKCDIKVCVRPDCLLEGTQKQNMQDMVERRRHNPVLSEEDVVAVRHAVKSGVPINTLARKHGVHWSVVKKVTL